MEQIKVPFDRVSSKNLIEIASVADAGRIGGGGRAGVVRVRGARGGLHFAAHADVV